MVIAPATAILWQQNWRIRPKFGHRMASSSHILILWPGRLPEGRATEKRKADPQGPAFQVFVSERITPRDGHGVRHGRHRDGHHGHRGGRHDGHRAGGGRHRDAHRLHPVQRR